MVVAWFNFDPIESRVRLGGEGSIPSDGMGELFFSTIITIAFHILYISGILE
jgi:TRAP-type mannitol/chloroaromatic compound transport system permease small subunit